MVVEVNWEMWGEPRGGWGMVKELELEMEPGLERRRQREIAREGGRGC